MAEEEMGKDLQEFDEMESEEDFEDLEEGEEAPGEGQKPPGAGAQPAKKGAGEGEEEPEGEEPPDGEKPPAKEPSVPLHRFQEVSRQLKELKGQISEKEKVPPSEMTAEEKQELAADKWLESRLERILEKREQKARAADAALAEELVDLQDVYGNFDVDKVLDIQDEFRRKGSTLSAEGALAIYFERNKAGKASGVKASPGREKPPQPKGTGTGEPGKKVDVSGKPLRQVVEEAKRDYGITK